MPTKRRPRTRGWRRGQLTPDQLCDLMYGRATWAFRDDAEAREAWAENRERLMAGRVPVASEMRMTAPAAYWRFDASASERETHYRAVASFDPDRVLEGGPCAFIH